MEGVVNGYADTPLALSEAEGASELYLIRKIILLDKLCELCYYLT